MAITIDPKWDIAEDLTLFMLFLLTSAELLSSEALTDRKA